MLARLATFLFTYRRRILVLAVIGAAIAGALGVGVAKRLSPYGANDPATQSVQATNRFQDASHRQIDPGVVAIVASGNVRRAEGEDPRGAGRRPTRAAARRRERRDLLHDTQPGNGLACRQLDLRRGVLQGVVGQTAQGRRTTHRGPLQESGRCEPGGGSIANAQANTQVGNDLARAELLAFPLIFLLSLVFFRSLVASLLPPFLGGLAIVTTFFALRVVSSSQTSPSSR